MFFYKYLCRLLKANKLFDIYKYHTVCGLCNKMNLKTGFFCFQIEFTFCKLTTGIIIKRLLIKKRRFINDYKLFIMKIVNDVLS